jgi:hypothetical protein
LLLKETYPSFDEPGENFMKVNVSLLVFMLLFITAPLSANPIQDFSFTDIDGKTHYWGDLKGAPLMINVGSHW